MHPLTEYIKAGETPKKGRVGIEVEHFVLDAGGHPLTYEALVPVLDAIAPFYERTGTEEGHVIELENQQALVTLEPGCQLELSFACTDDMAGIGTWYAREAGRIGHILQDMDARLVYSGGLPTTAADQVERILKRRYAFMERWFEFAGTRGKEMMKATASVHGSIDYENEEDFVRKVRAGYILHPLLAFLMSNTKTYGGKPNQDILLRDSIWHHTDSRRCGTIPGLFSHTFGYEAYAQWLAQMPVILVKNQGEYIYEGPMTVCKAGEKYGWDAPHIAHYLSMAFPDVRVKQCIEVRSADSVPQPYIQAYAALLKGLFYNEEVLDQVLSWAHSESELEAAKAALRQDGYEAAVYGKPVTDRLDWLLDHARLPHSEKAMLEPFRTLVKERKHIYE